MDYVIASSRGFELKSILPKGTTVDVNPGGSLKLLTARALTLLPSTHRLPATPHVYFIAGIPDLTEKLTSPKKAIQIHRKYLFQTS